MEVEDAAVNGSKNGLEFFILLESLLIPIKPRECCTNVCISSKEGLEDTAVLTCELWHVRHQTWKDRILDVYLPAA